MRLTINCKQSRGKKYCIAAVMSERVKIQTENKYLPFG